MSIKLNSVPEWVRDSIFYQIFPERFENGDPSNDPSGVEAWGGTPKSGNFFGGDLRGIINRMQYLKDLGITALYLNPIFEATTNHKYNATDYKKIDPSFGTNELFTDFITTCHANGIKVVLDGVFNHVGVNHFAFQDVVKNGAQSQYASWFNVYSYPVSSPRHPNYECWWGIGSLPKLMVQNPAVKEYLFSVARFWTGKIDGWRLDVPDEIPHEFWKEWRKVVRDVNPDCYIVGELWFDASPWLKGDEFDATMNYRFRSACLDYFAHDALTPSQFLNRLEKVRSSYTADHNFAMLNLLDSHDTERFLTLAGKDTWRVKQASLFQMTYLGAPMVYYGDEIGMEGGKDPDCRRCMVWETSRWNDELLSHYRTLIDIRKRSVALRRGSFTVLSTDDNQGLMIYKRSGFGQNAYIVINNSNAQTAVKIPVDRADGEGQDAVTEETFSIHQNVMSVDVPEKSGRIFLM